MIDVLTGGSPTDEDVQRCIAHLTRVGQDAVDHARHHHTLAVDVTATDIACQMMGLTRVAQLLPDARPGTLTRQAELALRGRIASEVAPPSGATRPRPTWRT